MFRKHNLFFGLVVSACPLSADAASVSGQFALGGKPLKPAEVAAFRMRDQFHPRDLETYVMLTTKAVNKEKIKAAIDPYAVARNDPAKILALLAPDKAKSYNEDYNTPAENLKSAKEILDARLPKQLKITGGEWLADDHALLEVEGVPYANGRMLYLVDMRRIDGA